MRGSIRCFQSTCCQELCHFTRSVLSRECPLREGPLYLIFKLSIVKFYIVYTMQTCFAICKHCKLHCVLQCGLIWDSKSRLKSTSSFPRLRYKKHASVTTCICLSCHGQPSPSQTTGQSKLMKGKIDLFCISVIMQPPLPMIVSYTCVAIVSWYNCCYLLLDTCKKGTSGYSLFSLYWRERSPCLHCDSRFCLPNLRVTCTRIHGGCRVRPWL